MVRNFVIVDTAAQPAGWNYYTQQGVIIEPLGNGQSLHLTASDARAVSGLTLMNIVRGVFEEMVGTGEQCNVLVVCHANTEDLLIPVSPDSSVQLTPETMQMLTFWGEQLQNNRLRAEALGITVEEMQVLLDMCAIIREDKLIQHLAIRACRLGQNFQCILQFIEILGCQSVSVPLVKDAYSAFTFNSPVTSEEMDKAISLVENTLGPGAAHVYSDRHRLRKERLMWYLQLLEGSRFKTVTIAESQRVFEDFLQEKVSMPGRLVSVAPQKPVWFHALSDGRRNLVFQPDPQFAASIKYYNPAAPAGPAIAPETKKTMRERIRERLKNRKKVFAR
jgi:hypothetical protein